jgi:DNA-binding response OmpR family regulator
MQILIAEDDAISRRMLEATLSKWAYDPVVTCNGREALKALEAKDCPRLAILDWMMPEMDGLEVCRRIRAATSRPPVYVLLLTAKGTKQDIVTGLEAGADDYLAKPFDRNELRARLHVGQRLVELQCSLADRVRQLEDALANVKQLQGLIPICCYCKKIRGDQNYWQQVEAYMTAHSEARFSHGICPECMDTVVRRELEQLAQFNARVDSERQPGPCQHRVRDHSSASLAADSEAPPLAAST